MANLVRDFTKGRMNKSTDERLVPNGEYVDATNIRLGSTEDSEVGAIENAKGNTRLTTIQYVGQTLSSSAKCIGAFQDGSNETIYWFIHDDDFALGTTSILDLIVSLNVKTNVLTYHVVSMDDGTGVTSTLNFSHDYLINDVNIVEDLIFFTDNYNPPRVFNRKRSYSKPNGSYVDTITGEELLVIKKPPTTSPSLDLVSNTSTDNFLEDKFVCFAYRYRYEDGEYSAISQFSEPAFIPGSFNFDPKSYLNTGMENSINEVILTYNSGGPLVKSIELLFKETQNNVVKVIERLDKDLLGLVDNNSYTYRFDNSKIYTVLPDTELLRLYDNVPKLARTQTVMGNRLVYGNYLEGYDLIDLNNNPLKLEYTASILSTELAGDVINGTLADTTYSIDPASTPTITNAAAVFDLTGVDLIAGALLEFSVTLSHDSFSGFTSPTQETDGVDLSFSYILPEAYSSVYELATSTDFLEKIGVVGNIQTVANSCDGNTFTDAFNCSIPSTLDTYAKDKSGILAIDEPINVISAVSSSVITFEFPSMRFVDTGNYVYEYYVASNPVFQYRGIASSSSLHSNRDYEVGIVYMDEYNRSTTALVSSENDVHIPCNASDTQNKIRIEIPPTQVAPSFATRYKFVIKPGQQGYETIYSNIFYTDPSDNSVYFLLEGENARKVEEGDRLIVKADTTGPKNTCTYATVLEKEAKEENFISTEVVNETVQVPGVYMKINPNGFTAVVNEEDGDAVVNLTYPTVEEKEDGDFPKAFLPANIESETIPGQYNDFTIPAGSIINFSLEFKRGKSGAGSNVNEERFWSVNTSFTSPVTYANFKDWFDGENIDTALQAQATKYTNPESRCQPVISYDNTVASAATAADNANISEDGCTNYLRFWRDPSPASGDGQLILLITGDKSEGSADNKKAIISVSVSIIRTGSTIVFETIPQEAPAEIWYESSDSYSIDSNGNHSGNVRDQDISSGLSALIDTDFFNCYTFGNGVESQKIRDSVIGKPLNLGQRTTTVSEQDYREIRRFADLTYSGVYNDETNLNKLNEFNLGLLNFKPLEDFYGPIQKIFARKTDILVLQEDKISYVLAGKNLISDSTGGGTIASVPEVLGTQIARMEEYGISHNPESFAVWGYDKFFTDAKRGAVIKLTGGDAGEQLTVISEAGMRPWFRDLFIDSFKTQKLGGYDPYMDEYVLSSNDTVLPEEAICVNCGSGSTYTVTAGTNYTYCIDAGELVGDVDIDYTIISADGTVTIDATYDGATDTTGAVAVSGTLTITKDNVSESQIDIEISSSTGTAVLEVFVGCPQAETVTIIQVTVSDNEDTNKLIHNEYRWEDGAFNSPLHTTPIKFVGGTTYPLVSQYDTLSGPQGAGFIPSDTATVSIISNKKEGDDFTFNTATDRLLYLRSNTLYENNATDIASLLAAASVATPFTISGQSVLSTFDMPDVGTYLYLIWDYRSPFAAELCYSATSAEGSCFDCGDCDCSLYEITNANSYTVAVDYTNCDTSLAAVTKVKANQTIYISSETLPAVASTAPTGSDANVTITYQECGNTASTGDNCFINTTQPGAEIRVGTQEDPDPIIFSVAASSPFTSITQYSTDGRTWNGSYYPVGNAIIQLAPTCTSDTSISFVIDCSLTTANSGIPTAVDTTNLNLLDSSNTPINGTWDGASSDQVTITFDLGTRQLDTIKWAPGSYMVLQFD